MPVIQTTSTLSKTLHTEQGIQLLLEKLIAITNLREPNNMDELCHFPGLTSYYRRFIPLFADITKPLNKLLLCKAVLVYLHYITRIV